MKILFVTATYLPTVNGVSYHINLLKRQLEKLGHKIYVLAPNFPGYKDSESNVIRYFSMPNPFVTNYPLGLPLVSLSKIKILRPDIIHTHHPLIIGTFASYLSEKIKVPLVFTAHTQYEQYLNYYFPHGYQITSKLLINDLKNLSKKSFKVICPSPETEKRLNEKGIKNTITIFNGIDTHIFTSNLKIFKDYPSIVFTGRIEKEKNPLLLIKVARELKRMIPKFRITIIGEGNLLTTISEQIFKYKLENYICLAGKVNRELLPSIYQTANIFFTPSVSEVMPLSLLEAQSCGLPIIALKNANLDSIIEDNKSGYILKSDPKLIANKITDLVTNKKKLIIFSKRSREISENYSLEKCAVNVLRLYKEACID